MLILSNLLRYKLEDSRQKKVTLSDLAIDLSIGDYPPVTYIIGHQLGQERIRVPWDSVRQ